MIELLQEYSSLLVRCGVSLLCLRLSINMVFRILDIDRPDFDFISPILSLFDKKPKEKTAEYQFKKSNPDFGYSWEEVSADPDSLTPKSEIDYSKPECLINEPRGFF